LDLSNNLSRITTEVTSSSARTAFSITALVMAAITGGLALAAARDKAQFCSADGHCDPAFESEGKRGLAFANASTAGFVLAGVGAAVGIPLIILRPGAAVAPALGGASLRVAF